MMIKARMMLMARKKMITLADTHITVVPHTIAPTEDNFVQLSFDNFLLFQ